MLKMMGSLFLTGLVLGSGPCLLSCGPLLLSYIAAAKKTFRQSLRIYLVFSITRLVVYMALGAVAGFLGEWVLRRFFESRHLSWFFFLFGIFLIFLAVLVLFDRKGERGGLCRPVMLKCTQGAGGLGTEIGFGLLIALSPCAPLLAVIGYIGLISDHWFKGLSYMASFGLGTVVSPLILLAGFSGWIIQLIERRGRFVFFVRVFGALVLLALGLSLLKPHL